MLYCTTRSLPLSDDDGNDGAEEVTFSSTFESIDNEGDFSSKSLIAKSFSGDGDFFAAYAVGAILLSPKDFWLPSLNCDCGRESMVFGTSAILSISIISSETVLSPRID